MRTCPTGRQRVSLWVRAAAGGGDRGVPEKIRTRRSVDRSSSRAPAPGPPLPPRDEPLAQTGPERFVRSARVRQGWAVSPGARPTD